MDTAPTNVFAGKDLRLQKLLFAHPKFWHHDGDSAKPLLTPEVAAIQPVDESGNCPAVLGSSVTARMPHYLIESPSTLSALSAEDDFIVKLTGFGGIMKPEMLEGFNEDFGWQAPEIVLEPKMSPKADVWSLGCVIMQLLTGIRPYVPEPSWKSQDPNEWDERDKLSTKEELPEQWVEIFGDLPEKWEHHYRPLNDPPYKPGEYNIRDRLHRRFIGLRGDWFSKEGVDTWPIFLYQ
ncbi:hypothetical protein ACLMJK_005872 [Lecanora helva]